MKISLFLFMRILLSIQSSFLQKSILGLSRSVKKVIGENEKNNFINKISFRTISLKAEDNDCFDFCCSLSPSCSAFSVSPWSGKISGESELKITYCPTEFVTSSTKLRITFSTFDRKVLEVGFLKLNQN